MGLAAVYFRQGASRQALEALDTALHLDASRADIHIARGRVLLARQELKEAQLEFRRAAELEPANSDAKAALRSLHAPTKHQLLLGTETDLSNLSGFYQQNNVALLSHWSEHFRTGFEGSSYVRGGADATKIQAAVTAISPTLGGLTIGGAAARDNGIIPRHEAFLLYDRAWKFRESTAMRALEFLYAQHWYWYSTARIMVFTETTMVYLPRDWTWSLAVSGARSTSSVGALSWTPSGTSKLTFPVLARERHGVHGNVFFACGTENFSHLDQIGAFASRTYGGGLRLELTTLQDMTAFAAYQMRSQNRTQTSFGLTYGLRF
jgi:hypothetical protein